MYLPADLLTHQIWLADVLTLTPNLPAAMGEGYMCQQIYWLSPNLLADLLTFNQTFWHKWGDVSAGKYTDCHQIWLSTNLQAEMGGISASRFTDSPNLLADLLTFTPNLPADFSKSTGRFTDFHTNSCGRFPDFNTRSASRLTDSPNLLEDLLTLTLNLPA